MNPLPKHLRPRWRYLAVGVETWPGADVGRDALQRVVWRSARALLGDPGSADADLTVVRFSGGDGTGEAVVRTRRDEVGRARAALACVERVDGHPVGLRVRGTSGTVRACEEKYLGRAGEHPGETTVAFDGADRPAVRRDGRVDVRTDGAFVGATDLDFE